MLWQWSQLEVQDEVEPVRPWASCCSRTLGSAVGARSRSTFTRTGSRNAERLRIRRSPPSSGAWSRSPGGWISAMPCWHATWQFNDAMLSVLTKPGQHQDPGRAATRAGVWSWSALRFTVRRVGRVRRSCSSTMTARSAASCRCKATGTCCIPPARSRSSRWPTRTLFPGDTGHAAALRAHRPRGPAPLQVR